jgi:hypothetical protein
LFPVGTVRKVGADPLQIFLPYMGKIKIKIR